MISGGEGWGFRVQGKVEGLRNDGYGLVVKGSGSRGEGCGHRVQGEGF